MTDRPTSNEALLRKLLQRRQAGEFEPDDEGRRSTREMIHRKRAERFVSSSRTGIITMVPGLRGGRPVIRGMRITVGDILGWLASGMSEAEILEDFPDLTVIDIRAALAFAAERKDNT